MKITSFRTIQIAHDIVIIIFIKNGKAKLQLEALHDKTRIIRIGQDQLQGGPTCHRKRTVKQQVGQIFFNVQPTKHTVIM